MRFFCALTACILWCGSTSTAEELDISRFTPPPGWKASRSAGNITYTQADEKAGTYCLLGVYPSTAGKGDVNRDFAAEWEAIVRKGFTAGPPPQPMSGRTHGGLSFVAGGAQAAQGAIPSYVKLFVFPADSRVVSVLVCATNAEVLAKYEPVTNAVLDSLRIQGIAAPSAGTAPPTTAPVAMLSALTVPMPNGWQRSEANGGLILERVVDLGFGQKNVFRLIFAPPVRMKENSLATFGSLWNQFAGQTFASPVRPLPLRVRLKSGATLLYDGGNVQLKEGNVEVTGLVYVVVQGDMAMPVIGVFSGWDQPLDQSLREIFDGVRLTDGSAKEPPLFRREELVGKWRSSSSTLGNWVDAAGNYRGDAGLATGETLSLNADGTYRSQFAAVGQGRTVRSDTSGTFSVDDDLLTLRPGSGEQATHYRITGVGHSADGKAGFLILGISRDDFPALSAGSSVPRAGDLYVGVRD